MKVNITFKKQPRSTGLARIGEGYTTEMKIKKKRFGSISTANWNQKWEGWKISFAVKDGESRKWKSYIKTFKTEEEARDFAKEVFPAQLEQLYFFGD